MVNYTVIDLVVMVLSELFEAAIAAARRNEEEEGSACLRAAMLLRSVSARWRGVARLVPRTDRVMHAKLYLRVIFELVHLEDEDPSPETLEARDRLLALLRAVSVGE